MKIHLGPNAQGQPHHFEVSNVLLSRRGACQIIASIPGVEILRKPKFWAFWSDDVFCVFALAGRTFEISEPFGDNSRFHIGANPPGWRAELEVIRSAFAAR